MLRKAMIGASLALSGCVSAQLVPLPDGTSGYVVKNCKDMAQCYVKAAEVCHGSKYELVDKSSNTEGAMTGGAGYLSGGIETRYSMTIRCEKAP